MKKPARKRIRIRGGTLAWAAGAVFLLFMRAQKLQAAESNNSSFSLSPAKEAVILAAGISASALSFAELAANDFPDWNGEKYDLSGVNKIDSFFARPYSRPLDIAGTASCAVNMAVLPLAFYMPAILSKNLQAKEAATLCTMYAESWLLSYGVKNLLKISAKRVRPYMYFSSIDEDSIDNHDFELSWPSGHTTDSFMAASFLTYTYCALFPSSTLKIPVAALSFTTAALTAGLRMASGNHFLTDVLSGAALGTLIGLGVPLLHRSLLPQSSALRLSESTTLSITPLSALLHVKF